MLMIKQNVNVRIAVFVIFVKLKDKYKKSFSTG